MKHFPLPLRNDPLTSLSVPTINRETGSFAGYASIFNTEDSGGDIIAPGAFSKTLKRRGLPGVKMLWQHKATEPIGVWTSITEDAQGLHVEGRLDLSVARAREALSLIRTGALDGLSIGFRTVRERKMNGGARLLLEIDLWEISLVTFPMLSQARISNLKTCSPFKKPPWLPPASFRAYQAASRLDAGLARLRHSLNRQ